MSRGSPRQRPQVGTKLARREIDPTFASILEALPTIFNLADGVDAVRARVEQLQVPPEMLPALRIEDRTVGYGGHTDIAVRSYWPAVDAPNAGLPIIVYYHGGGWSTGDLDTHDAVARAHCVAADDWQSRRPIKVLAQQRVHLWGRVHGGRGG